MEPNTTIKLFSDFGLTTYETKSYLSLLEKNALSAVEVAKISGVPRGRIYEVLENLLTKGFCRSIPGKVKKYTAVDPVILRDKITPKMKNAENDISKRKLQLKSEIKRIKQELDEEIDQRQKELDDEIKNQKRELEKIQQNTETVIENLTPLYKASRTQDNPLENIEVIKNPLLIHRMDLQLSNEAEAELLCFIKFPFIVSQDKLEEQAKSNYESLKRGVKVKFIYEIPSTRDKNERIRQLDTLNILVNVGLKVRFFKKLPMKMSIRDERIVMSYLENKIADNSSLLDTVLVVEHVALARSLKMLFESIWHQAVDYDVLKKEGHLEKYLETGESYFGE